MRARYVSLFATGFAFAFAFAIAGCSDPGGHPAQPTGSGTASQSPPPPPVSHGPFHGKLAFSSGNTNTRIFVMPLDGSGKAPVAVSAGPMDFQPAISPDGKSIAFLHYLGDPTGLGVQAEIHVVNADGTNEHKVADCACDGRSKIAYYRDGSILYGYVRTLEAGGIDANLMKVKDGQAPEVWIKGAGPHVIHANASGGLVVNGPALVDFAKGMIGPTLPDLGGTVEDFFQITSARVYYEFKDTPGLNGEIHSVALAGGSPRKEPFSPVASTQVGFYGNDFVVADDDSFAILETPGTDGKHESLSAYTVANGVATPQSIPGLPAQIEQGQYFGVTIGLGP